MMFRFIKKRDFISLFFIKLGFKTYSVFGLRLLLYQTCSTHKFKVYTFYSNNVFVF